MEPYLVSQSNPAYILHFVAMMISFNYLTTVDIAFALMRMPLTGFRTDAIVTSNPTSVLWVNDC